MENLELFADLPAPARAPQGWAAVEAAFGRSIAWACLRFPGAVVRHCGHPTALYPYYVTGVPALHGRTFKRLKTAQAAVETTIRPTA